MLFKGDNKNPEQMIATDLNNNIIACAQPFVLLGVLLSFILRLLVCLFWGGTVIINKALWSFQKQLNYVNSA